MIKMCPAKAQANILYFMIVINIDYFVSTVSFLKKKIITAIKPYWILFDSLLKKKQKKNKTTDITTAVATLSSDLTRVLSVAVDDHLLHV